MKIEFVPLIVIFGMGMLASFGSYFLKKAAMGGLSLGKLLTCRVLYAGRVLYVASALLNYYLLDYSPAAEPPVRCGVSH